MLYSRFALTAALACALLAACGHRSDTTTTTTNDTTQSQSTLTKSDDDSTFAIDQSIGITSSQDGGQVTSFATTDNTMWFKAHFNHPKAGQQVTFQLVYTKDGSVSMPLSTQSVTTDDSATFAQAHFTNSNPWPAGNYTIKVSINGTEAESRDFTVQ